jgi:hypothetical protein
MVVVNVAFAAILQMRLAHMDGLGPGSTNAVEIR